MDRAPAFPRRGNLEEPRIPRLLLPRARGRVLFASLSFFPSVYLSFSHSLSTGRIRPYFGDTYLLREERPMCTYVRRHLHTAGVGTVDIRARRLLGTSANRVNDRSK